MDNIKQQVIEQAYKLQDFLIDLETLFLTEKEFEELSFYPDPTEKVLTMLKDRDMEREWFKLNEEFRNRVDEFVEKWS